MKAVEVDNLTFAYNGRKILRNVSLSVDEGELLMILGPNGAGKTTLLRFMAGIIPSDKVKIFGRSVKDYSRGELAKLVTYVPQRAVPSFLTVLDTVLLGRRPYIGFSPTKGDIEIAYNTLKRLGIEELALRPTRELSGGELQKVNIARALAQDSKIILLDEPTNNLDLKSQLEVMKLARELTVEGKTVIMVMHDVNMALRFARRLVFLSEGKIVADGGPEILSPELFREVYGTEVEIEEVRGIPLVVPL